MTEPEPDGTWRIGALARKTGVTVRTLRHYEALGLVSPSSRTAGGHRCYTEGDVRRLHRVLTLRGFGLSLGRIATTLDAEPDHDPAELMRDQLTVVEERIRRSVELRDRLLTALDALDHLVKPSVTEFLQIIKEMTTMNTPLTPDQVAALSRAREEHRAQLSEAELAAMDDRRRAFFAALTPQERATLATRRRRLLPG